MAQPPLVHVASPEIEGALADKMAQIALKEKEQETQTKANGLGLGYINLVGFPIGPETIAVINQPDAERLRVICFLRTTDQLRLAAVNPEDPDVRALARSLGEKLRVHMELYIISEHSLASALHLYTLLPKKIATVSGVTIDQDDLERYREQIGDIRQLDQYLTDVSTSDMFTFLLAGAIQSRSSDIHIEAEDSGIRVRYRIDGVLTPVATLPTSIWPRVISRIKLMAGLKLNITKVPQDGRISVFLKDDKIDVRVSTLPTAFGESVVMRLLRSSASSITFADLGLRGRAYEELKKEIDRPNGMVIITGPTGSGKSTTLYAILNQLNQPDTKIITLEDPIEYKLKGINQSQVDWSKEYTFAKGLRSILRQDPDIVMVGEIRDIETADTAIQAALTGHLVLSTIHTNDAAGAIPRFLSMGAKSYLLAPALNAVVAQRLVRKICPHCVVDDELDTGTLEMIAHILTTIPVTSGHRVEIEGQFYFKKGRGCDQCHGIGYLGRIGIFEVLVVDAEVEKLILDNQITETTIRQAAEHQGMVTMAQDGILKAIDGITTIEEVFRVAQ